jgi:DNA-binding XRE family transcriptional regulator
MRRVIPGKLKIREDLYFSACRAKGALRQEDRAVLLGMPRKSVHRYEKNKVEPKISTARWIASQLDLTVDELWPDQLQDAA